jgi:hypothetical protein
MISVMLACLALGEVPAAGAPLVEVLSVDAGTPGLLSELHWDPLVDVFGEYDFQQPTGAASFNTFAIPRAQLGLQGDWRGVRGRVVVEGVYSTQGGALIGTAGDSVVARFREAWGGYRWRFLEARLGMVPTLVVPALEGAWGLRVLAPDGLEAQRLVAPADLGATLRAVLPAGFGWAAIAVTNGEGYTQRELDGRKNVELAAVVRPLPQLAAPLEVLLAYQYGSTGTTSERSDRLGGALLWNGARVGGGAAATWLLGLADDGGRRGLLLQAFARAELFERLLLAARVHWLNRDLTGVLGDNSAVDVIASVGARVAAPLEIFASFHRALLSPLARAALPGSDVTGFRVTLRLRWPLNSTFSQETPP